MNIPEPTLPKVYVGTYNKYVVGNLTGKWLSIGDYAGKEEFLEACAKLHGDESDPEFMFQDSEGIPAEMIDESDIDDGLWEWLELDDDERELLSLYREEIDQDGDIEEARDMFAGVYDSPELWAEDFLEGCGVLLDVPSEWRKYIDFESFARDCECEGMNFIRHNGETWVFHNC